VRARSIFFSLFFSYVLARRLGGTLASSGDIIDGGDGDYEEVGVLRYLLVLSPFSPPLLGQR